MFLVSACQCRTTPVVVLVQLRVLRGSREESNVMIDSKRKRKRSSNFDVNVSNYLMQLTYHYTILISFLSSLA